MQKFAPTFPRLTLATVVLATWGLVLTTFVKLGYDLLMLALLTFPWCIVAALKRHAKTAAARNGSGLAATHTQARQTGPLSPTAQFELLLMFFFACITLGVRASLDFNLLHASQARLPAFILAVILLVYLLKADREFKRPVSFVIAAALSLFYAHGAVVSSNCLLDGSAPSIAKVTVVDKQRTQNKKGNKMPHYSYYLQLAPWEPAAPEMIEVSRALYTQTRINDELQLSVRAGRWNLAWFELPEPGR